MRLGFAVLGLTGAATVRAGPATVRAQALGPRTPEPPPAGAAARAAAAAAPARRRRPTATRFGGAVRYLVEAVEVHGNRKTDPALILRELGLGRGDVLTADDRACPPPSCACCRSATSCGCRCALKGLSIAGAAPVVLMVDVEERGTVILNALYLGTSEATLLWGGLDVSETNFLGRGMIDRRRRRSARPRPPCPRPRPAGR